MEYRSLDLSKLGQVVKSTSPPGTSHFGFLYSGDWRDSVVSTPQVPWGLAGLSPFRPPGTLETGRTQPYNPPRYPRDWRDLRHFSHQLLLGLAGLSPFSPPQVPWGLAGVSPSSPLRYPGDWRGLSRFSPPISLGTGSSRRTGTGESLTESR